MENKEGNLNKDEKILVPNNIQDFTPKWCEWALKESQSIGSEVIIENVETKRLSDEASGLSDGGGMTDALILRIKLSYCGKTSGKEPDTVIVKWFSNLTNNLALKWRLMFRMLGTNLGSGLEENIYRMDITFYRHIIPLIKDKFLHPKVYYTGIIDKGNRNFWNGTLMNKPCKLKTITLMEDMNDGWESLDFLRCFQRGGLDSVNNEACLRNIAILHAAF